MQDSPYREPEINSSTANYARNRLFVWLNSIHAQLLMILFLALVIFNSAFYLTSSLSSQKLVAPPVAQFTARLMGHAEILMHLPGHQKKGLVDQLNRQTTGVNYQLMDRLPQGVAWRTEPRHEVLRFLRDISLSYTIRQVPLNEDKNRVTLFFRFPDDQIFAAETVLWSKRKKKPKRLEFWDKSAGKGPQGKPGMKPPDKHLFQYIDPIQLFRLVSLVLLVLWSFVAIIRPLRTFAVAANKFATGSTEPQRVAIRGPSELRMAARALNGLQDRIHHLLEDRTRMLAAVGHDLRTPVTRLRLRAEMVGDRQIKAEMLRDIEQMDSQLSRLMSYFRTGQNGEKANPLDLGSLLDSVAGEWSDSGHPVEYQSTGRVIITGRSGELMRMVDNLVANAIRYAGGCQLSLRKSERWAVLEVIDHGKGIAEADKEAMLTPFVRGDEARNMDEVTGFGLGLAIAHDVAAQHGALFALLDTKGGGLTVQIKLPLHHSG